MPWEKSTNLMRQIKSQQAFICLDFWIMLPYNEITSCIWLKPNYLERNIKLVQINLFYATSRNLFWFVLFNLLHNNKAIIAACLIYFAVNQEFSNPGKTEISFAFSLQPILLAVVQLSWNLHEFRQFLWKWRQFSCEFFVLCSLREFVFVSCFFHKFCCIFIFSRE